MSEAAAATGAATAAPSGGEATSAATTATGAENTQQATTETDAKPENTTDTASEPPVSKEAKPEAETPEPQVETAKPIKKQLREWAKESLEKEFDDDDQADDFVREFATNSHKLNKQLMDAFDSQPELGAITSMVVKDGVPWIEAMGEFLTPEEYENALNDTEGGRKALAKRLENLKNQKKQEAEVAKNREESGVVLTEFMKEKGMSEAQANDLFDNTVLPIMQSLINQKFDKATLEKFLMLHNYKKDITDAQKLGEAKALNGKNLIEKETRKGDGLPQLNGGGGAAKTVETAQKKMSSVARVAQQNQLERSKL